MDSKSNVEEQRKNQVSTHIAEKDFRDAEIQIEMSSSQMNDASTSQMNE